MGQVGQLRYGALHAVSHLILGHARQNLGISSLFEGFHAQGHEIVQNLRLTSLVKPLGSDKYSTGSPLERNLTP